jgi:hypothetical protein
METKKEATQSIEYEGMTEQSTCDTILKWMQEQAESKAPINPMLYMEAAVKLNAMIGEEDDKYIDLSSAAKRQEAKIKQITEAIRLAKKYAHLKSEEMRSGL